MGNSSAGSGSKVAVLVHNEGDHVGVAVTDLAPGEVLAGWLDSQRREQIAVNEPVMFGHKVALVDLASGADVTEYGVRIAVTRNAISRGDLVHTHNVRSARWHQSA